MTDKTPKGRIVCIAGPKEGAGKTTVALNLALAWAGTQPRRVLIAQLDPLCRDDISGTLGLRPPALAELASARGRAVEIPVSQWGVGSLPLAASPEEATTVSAAAATRVLRSLSGAYDLFLDVEPSSPLLEAALALADTVFWVCLPHRAHLEASYPVFRGLQARRYPFARMSVVVNASDQTGALTPELVEQCFATLGKPAMFHMPWQDSVPACANAGRILVAESVLSPWAGALRSMLGRLLTG